MAVLTTVSQLADHVGEVVTLRGWLANKSSKGKLHFVQFRDGSGFCQCVLFKKNVDEALFEAVGHAGQESSLILTGEVVADERAPGGFEIKVSDGRVLQAVEGYPITPKEHGPDFLLSNRHLWLRSRRQWAVLRVRDAVITSIRRFFDERGFINVDAPMFTPNACEGTSDLFEVDYFDRKAYLTQSGQLYGEAAAMAHGRIYTFGPTFRAEKSKTRRHLTEFWMVEPEVAYLDLEGDMELAEDFVVEVVGTVLAERGAELELLGRDLAALERVQKPFPRLSYSEAVEILEREGRKHTWGTDFGAEEETLLASRFDRPVMIHRYPADCKAFYMKADPEDERLALCVDMLAPEGYGEIIGGGQREDDLALLERRLADHDLPSEAFEWYLDLRRYGAVPHAGFGMGIERMVAWLCGIHHVRETIPFPRMLERTTP